ncbi:MAG: DUF4276 family protein [Bryobacterales bacterium]|nr:DUF4276 family protein [Bryobacterales bacterium]
MVFVEGGGDRNKALATGCRRGFRTFIEKAGFDNRMPTIIACGGRLGAYKRFCTAIQSHPSVNAILLVDSEAPVTAADRWHHVRDRPGDRWTQPAGSTPEQIHLMVQTMEAWFHCDVEALANYYGSGFQRNSLRSNLNVEQIAKKDLFDGLKKATQRTRKGAYSKGLHSFEILSLIDPRKVHGKSGHAARFLDYLDKVLTSS